MDSLSAQSWELTQNETNMETFLDEIRHFFKCINFGASALDARAITFMNEITKKIEDVHEQGRKVGYDEGFEAGQKAALGSQ